VSARTEIPLYSYDGALIAWITQQRMNRLETMGLASVVRHKKGTINRVVMHHRPGDPRPTVLRDYLGTRYSFREHLEDGHVCWRLRALGDRPSEANLAPEKVRPIFLRVLLECVKQPA
jgi:hypothetical protein